MNNMNMLLWEPKQNFGAMPQQNFGAMPQQAYGAMQQQGAPGGDRSAPYGGAPGGALPPGWDQAQDPGSEKTYYFTVPPMRLVGVRQPLRQ